MVEESYQFDVWDSTAVGVESVMRVLRDILDGFRGDITTGGAELGTELLGEAVLGGEALYIRFTDISSIFGDLEEPSQGKTVGIGREVVNVTFWYIP